MCVCVCVDAFSLELWPESNVVIAIIISFLWKISLPRGGSFSSTATGVGLPLGNLTSQLLVNIYMNEFDQYMKHRLKAEYYIRYADDFVIFSNDKVWLENMIPKIRSFLDERLHLQLHPNKISIKTVVSGMDYLGWVHFPDHRILRTVTKRRMINTIRRRRGKIETVQSYLGVLSHGNSEILEKRVKRLAEDIVK